MITFLKYSVLIVPTTVHCDLELYIFVLYCSIHWGNQKKNHLPVKKLKVVKSKVIQTVRLQMTKQKEKAMWGQKIPKFHRKQMVSLNAIMCVRLI
jgi:hypothetical protein